MKYSFQKDSSCLSFDFGPLLQYIDDKEGSHFHKTCKIIHNTTYQYSELEVGLIELS